MFKNMGALLEVLVRIAEALEVVALVQSKELPFGVLAGPRFPRPCLYKATWVKEFRKMIVVPLLVWFLAVN